MGAYSSWAMLALTHHFIVQVSAWRCGYPITSLYKAYALLGDDLVIGDKDVADSYLRIMAALGVGINLAKSIISDQGSGLEFAKRTFIDGQDVSPISLRELSESLQPGNISSWVAFANKYDLSFSDQTKILGFGYKTCKTEFMRMSSGLKMLWLTNIAKVDFSSETLNLRFKSPVNFNTFESVNLFKSQVLIKILNQINSKLTGPWFRDNSKTVDPLTVIAPGPFDQTKVPPKVMTDDFGDFATFDTGFSIPKFDVDIRLKAERRGIAEKIFQWLKFEENLDIVASYMNHAQPF
jgi:hypothetical protein